MALLPDMLPGSARPDEQWLSGDLGVQFARLLGAGPTIELDAFHYHDLICLATGVFRPLGGFQDHAAVASVLDRWRLPTGEIWPIPVTLPVPPDTAGRLKVCRLAALRFQGRIVGGIHVEDVFWLEPAREASGVYGTTDPAHPGVARVLSESPIRAAGTVTLIGEPSYAVGPVLTPSAMRRLIESRGWRRVAAFQTRNPLHRAHEYIQKAVLEWVDGLILHPLVGPTKRDDVPAAVRFRAYQALLAGYYPKERVILSGFPAAMRYAGPREAVLHAVARKNYGVTDFIVGRDHAGVGGFYSPTASQRAFDGLGDLGVAILTPHPAFYCRRCRQMATERTCPHGPGDREELSGTRIRTALAAGDTLPPELIRPEVADILANYYRAAPPRYAERTR